MAFSTRSFTFMSINETINQCSITWSWISAFLTIVWLIANQFNVLFCILRRWAFLNSSDSRYWQKSEVLENSSTVISQILDSMIPEVLQDLIECEDFERAWYEFWEGEKALPVNLWWIKILMSWPMIFLCNCSEIQQVLGLHVLSKVDAGLRDTVDWVGYSCFCLKKRGFACFWEFCSWTLSWLVFNC